MSAVLFALSIALLVFFVRRDLAEYNAFRLLTATRDRQRHYRIWVATGFILFFLYPLLGLACIHRTAALRHFPVELAPAALALRSHMPSGDGGKAVLYGFLASLTAGLLLGIFLAPRLRRSRRSLVLESVEPLMPRNPAELAHTAALSLNAGLSEEVFFRLFLPMLGLQLHFAWLASLLLAGLLFGLVHIYQGVAGVVSTTMLGLFLTVAYLLSGSLWLAVGLHIGLDLIQVVVRPGLRMYYAQRVAKPDDAQSSAS